MYLFENKATACGVIVAGRTKYHVAPDAVPKLREDGVGGASVLSKRRHVDASANVVGVSLLGSPVIPMFLL